jgi:hypothetical protein
MIVVHDLGTRLGCYGYDSDVSPHLDALAADGVQRRNPDLHPLALLPCAQLRLHP